MGRGLGRRPTESLLSFTSSHSTLLKLDLGQGIERIDPKTGHLYAIFRENRPKRCMKMAICSGEQLLERPLSLLICWRSARAPCPAAARRTHRRAPWRRPRRHRGIRRCRPTLEVIRHQEVLLMSTWSLLIVIVIYICFCYTRLYNMNHIYVAHNALIRRLHDDKSGPWRWGIHLPARTDCSQAAPKLLLCVSSHTRPMSQKV